MTLLLLVKKQRRTHDTKSKAHHRKKYGITTMTSPHTQPRSDRYDEVNVVTVPPPSPPFFPDTALSAENVRRACTSSRTQTAYRSCRRGVAAWIRRTKEESEQYFEPSGGIDVDVFTPKHFEEFLLSKMNASGKTLKVTTLGGYRSAIKDIYREKKLVLPAAYADNMKTFFAGLKRIEAERNQTEAGEAKMAGKWRCRTRCTRQHARK
jgi:hypothetical protein